MEKEKEFSSLNWRKPVDTTFYLRLIIKELKNAVFKKIIIKLLIELKTGFIAYNSSVKIKKYS